MARFAGSVGYITQVESSPDVWTSDEVVRFMKGDVIRRSASTQNDDKVNSDISLNHRISLLGDAFAFDNYYNIKWVEVDGFKWEVSSVEIQRPRIIVSLGGVYNE